MDVAGNEATTETIAYEGLKLEFEGPLATLTLDDPARLNAMSPAMAAGIADALVEVAKPRRKVRCLLITGAGRGFCAGANLAGQAKALASSAKASALGPIETAFHPMLRRLRALSIPVVAAVHGPCVGIGLGIALSADHVIASEAAFFLVPFRNLASAPDSGLTWLLPRFVGVQRARRMILRAERIPAALALDWGLIGEVALADEFDAAARAVALEFATGPTVALSEMKTLIARAPAYDLDGAMEAEALAVTRTSRTKDNVAAMRVFGSKEAAVFTGE